MVWSKIHSVPGPLSHSSPNDFMSALRTYLPLHGWVVTDRPGYEGNNDHGLFAYDYTDRKSGETHTLHYWAYGYNNANYCGIYWYGDRDFATSPGTSTSYDLAIYPSKNEDLTVWESSELPNAMLIMVGSKVMWFWPGYETLGIAGNNNPALQGYPMPWALYNGATSEWYGPPCGSAGSTTKHIQSCGMNPDPCEGAKYGTSTGYLVQGFGIIAMEYNYNYPAEEFAFINSPDILYEFNKKRANCDDRIIPSNAHTGVTEIRFDGTNYYIAIHDGSQNDGCNVWLNCGTTEPKFRHES